MVECVELFRLGALNLRLTLNYGSEGAIQRFGLALMLLGFPRVFHAHVSEAPNVPAYRVFHGGYLRRMSQPTTAAVATSSGARRMVSRALRRRVARHSAQLQGVGR